MAFTRNLKRYMKGDDVKEVKDKLLDLGYLAKSTTNMFGNDTYRAVIAFQQASGLEADGIVGELTYNALFGYEPPVAPEIPEHIGKAKATLIASSLATVSETRRQIVLEALKFAVDPDNVSDPKCFYIRGGNLYNTDLTVNTMTAAKLAKYFRNTSYEPYYKNSKGMMQEMSEKHGYTIAGCDCSGMVVGLWRHQKVCSTGFDANANSLYSSFCTKTDSPIPGDLAWRSGHIGLVVCANPVMIVESMGGDYGVQLTRAAKRQAHNFVDGKMHSFGKWTAYGDPKKY